MSFAEFLRDMAEHNHDDRDDGQTILPEAAIERLREAAANYAAGNPFKVGDLVTPRTDVNMRDAGSPHIVIDTTEIGYSTSCDVEPGDSSFGSRMDMRVICVIRDKIVPFWVEAWKFEPYHPA